MTERLIVHVSLTAFMQLYMDTDNINYLVELCNCTEEEVHVTFTITFVVDENKFV